MKRSAVALLVAGMALVGVVGSMSLADDGDGGRTLKATLRGIEEPPSVSSTGRGSFRATISEDGTTIRYTVTYADLEGDILQSHIHLGQRAANGGIAAFLCTNLANGPAGTPTCPGPRAGTVSGTITAAEVIGPSVQGLAPGEFEEFLRAIARGVTYANVHTTKHTSGEIRGQIDTED